MIARVETDLPGSATAGAQLSFFVRIVPGEPCPAGARVALVRHWPADWAPPQGSDPAAPDHLAVTLEPSGETLAWAPGRVEAWHPFDHAIFVTIPRALGANESVRFAATALGVQTFIEEGCPLSVRLDATGTGAWQELLRHRLRVVGGPPHRLVVTAPSDVVVGEEFGVHLRLEDVWGNPAQGAPVAVEIAGATGTIRAEDGSVRRLPLRLDSAGVHRLTARTASGFAAESNPILCHAAPPARRRYWGDIHAQSAIGCGARSIEAYFRHSRDFAAADFGSHQANCFLVSLPEWQETQDITRAVQQDGRYVSLLGVEWSGVPKVGGDHNIYWPGDEGVLHRCSHQHVADLSDADTDLPHITDVHAHYAGQDMLMAVHVGGRTSNLSWHAPALERLVEVHSTHATSEWMVIEALQRGWRFGITGGSDGVDGRLAASHPGRQAVRNLRGGLTAVPLPALTRPALWEALKAGRTYGTNGPRILLDVAEEAPGRLRVHAEGTAPIAAITLLRGGTEVACVTPPPRDPAPSGWWRLRWWGGAGRGNWSQTRLVWNGGATLSGATLTDARPWRWDTPAEGVVARDAGSLAWRSITAGSWDGVELLLGDIEPGATLRLRTQALDHDLPLDSGAVAHLTEHDPPRRLRLDPLPRLAAAPGWQGVIADPAPADAPYWLRVEQEDGGIAWSSPIGAEPQ
jgi:hypothetical protein